MADPTELSNIADALQNFKQAGSPADLQPKVQAFVQAQYDSLNKQGYWAQPENQAMGHSLRQMGVSDPTQGIPKFVQTGVDQYGEPTGGTAQSVAAARNARNIAAMKAAQGQGSDTAPPDTNPWQNNTQEALQAVNNVVTPIAQTAHDIGYTEMLAHQSIVTRSMKNGKVVYPAPGPSQRAVADFAGNLASGVPKLAGGLVSAGVSAVGGGTDYLVGKQQQMDANGAQYLAGVQQEAGFPGAAQASRQQAANLRANSDTNLKSANQVGGALVQGVTGGPTGGPAQAFAALKYLGDGDVAKAGAAAQSVADMAGKHFFENPVDTVALLAGGAGIAGDVASRLAAGGDVLSAALIKSAAAATAKGDTEAATAALGRAAQFQSASANLRALSVKANTLANPFHSQEPNVASNAAGAAENQAELLHRQADVQARQGDIDGARQSLTKAAQLQEQANTIRTAQGAPAPPSGTPIPDRAAPVTAGVDGAAPDALQDAPPVPLKMIAGTPLPGARISLPDGRFTAGGSAIPEGALNSDGAGPILPIVRAKNTPALPITEPAPVAPAELPQSAPLAPSPPSGGPVPIDVPAPAAVAAAESVAKSPKSEYAGSVNLDTMGLDEAGKAKVRAAIEASGSSVPRYESNTDTIAKAQSMGVTLQGLRDFYADPKNAPGSSPGGVDQAAFGEAIQQLHQKMKDQSITADAIHEQSPTPENLQAMIDANKNHADAAKFDSDYANGSGRTLQMRAAQSTPFEAAQSGDLFKSQTQIVPKAAFKTKPQTQARLANNKIFTADAVAAAQARIAARPSLTLKNFLTEEDGYIDHDALGDYVTIAGGYIEAGLRKFPEWAAKMREDHPTLTAGDLQAVWNGAKLELQQKTGVRQSPTVYDHFIDQYAKTHGRENANGFIGDLMDHSGDNSLLTKVIEGGKALTDDERRVVAAAEANNARTATRGALSPGRQALKDARDFVKQEAAGPAGQPKIKTPPTPLEQLHGTFRGRLGKENGDKFLAVADPDVLGRIASKGVVAPAEYSTLAKQYEQFRSAPKKPGAGPLDDFNGALSDLRKSTAQAAPKVAPDPDKVLDGHFARRLGSTLKAGQFRSRVGEPIYQKLAGNQALTDDEARRFGMAYQTTQEPRAPGTPTPLSKTLTETINGTKDAARQEIHNQKVGAWATRKAYVKDLVLKDLDPKRIPAFTKAYARVRPNNNNDLAEVYQRYGNRKTGENFKHALQGGFLSSLQTFGKIIPAHIAGHAVDEVGRPLTAPLSRGTVPGLDLAATGRELAAGVRAVPQAAKMLARGHNAITLAGENLLTRHNEPLTNEFTLQSKNPVLNAATPAINAAVRLPMRTHGAVYHVLGSAMYNRGISEAATIAVRMAEKMKGVKLSPAARRGLEQHLRANPTQEMIEHAKAYHGEQMFTNPNLLSDTVSGATHKSGPAIKGVVDAAMPFMKVGSNIAGREMEYTGLGAARHGLDYAMNKAAGKQEPYTDAQKAGLAKSISRPIIGGAAGALAAYELYKKGIVTAPNDQTGDPGSVNIPKSVPIIGGRSFQYGRSGPVSAPAVAATQWAQAVEQYGGADKIPATVKLQIVKRYMSENPVSNMAANLDTATDGTAAGMQRGINNAAAGFVPQAFGNAAAQFDPTHSKRQVSSPRDAVENMIPQTPFNPGFNRNQLPLKINTLTGKPVPESSGFSLLPKSIPTNQGPKQPIEQLSDALDIAKAKLAAFRPKNQAEADDKRTAALTIKKMGGLLGPYYGNAASRSYGGQQQKIEPISQGDLSDYIKILNDLKFGN
jgi:hypothetical protein